MKLLVAIAAFQRPKCLQRLLQTLAKVESAEGVSADLLISIDGTGSLECVEQAKDFLWSHGQKSVIQHESWMGLRHHIEWITDQVSPYDAIAILEDDLVVSPFLLRYARDALNAYGRDPNIAQISLYSPRFNEFGPTPFFPIGSKGDSFFCRIPSSWGQMVTPEAWNAYRQWQNHQQDFKIDSPRLPPPVKDWKNSWKKWFFNYISVTRKLVVYPKISLASNLGDAGTNFAASFPYFEVPVEDQSRNYRFISIRENPVIYDEFLEPEIDTEHLFGALIAKDLTIDLQGLRRLQTIQTRYLLSIRPCRNPIHQIKAIYFPPELNLRFPPEIPVESDDDAVLSVGLVQDFDPDLRHGRDYFLRRDPITSLERRLAKDSVEATRRYRIGNFVAKPFDKVGHLLNRSTRRRK